MKELNITFPREYFLSTTFGGEMLFKDLDFSNLLSIAKHFYVQKYLLEDMLAHLNHFEQKADEPSVKKDIKKDKASIKKELKKIDEYWNLVLQKGSGYFN